jgi:hypothetical protein
MALCTKVAGLDVSSGKAITLPAVAGAIAKFDGLGVEQVKAPWEIDAKIKEALADVGENDANARKLALVIAAIPGAPQITIPCDKADDESITSMALTALKGLQNLRTDDGLRFPQNAGWQKEADFSEHGDDMKTWMTNKHFSTLLSAFRDRSVNLNLQNTGLSGTLGLEQLGKHLKDGGCLRWVVLCFSPLLSPPHHAYSTTHSAITALDVSGCGFGPKGVLLLAAGLETSR